MIVGRNQAAAAGCVLRPGSARELGCDPGRLARAFVLLEERVAGGEIPGAVCAVGRRGFLHGPLAWGYAALAPAPEPMGPETVFDLASLTKPVATTTAVLSVIGDGSVRLDDPVSAFVPDFWTHRPARERDAVTLWRLLTHTAGLAAYLRPTPIGREGHAEILRRICATDPACPPGERVIYSCLGFVLLGEVVRRVTGMGLDAMVGARVLDPLGMRDTGFCPPPERAGRTAATEYSETEGRILRGVVHDEIARAMGGVSGNAGLFGTAADLAVFAQACLNGGTYGGARILSPAAMALATRDHTPAADEGRGLGWVVKGLRAGTSAGDLMSPSAFGHTGFTGTSLWIDPERDLFCILLTNRVHPSRANMAHLRLRTLFHNAVVAAVEQAGGE